MTRREPIHGGSAVPSLAQRVSLALPESLLMSRNRSLDSWRQDEKQIVDGRDAIIEVTGKYSRRVCVHPDSRPISDGPINASQGHCLFSGPR